MGAQAIRKAFESSPSESDDDFLERCSYPDEVLKSMSNNRAICGSSDSERCGSNPL